MHIVFGDVKPERGKGSYRSPLERMFIARRVRGCTLDIHLTSARPCGQGGRNKGYTGEGERIDSEKITAMVDTYRNLIYVFYLHLP